MPGNGSAAGQGWDPIRLLIRFMRPYAWTLPALVLLGLAAFLAEGLGVGLLVPVLQSMIAGPGTANAPGSLNMAVPYGFMFPRMQHLSSVVLVVLALVTSKGVLVYANEMLGSWLASRVSHLVRSSVFSSIMEIDHVRLDTLESGRLMYILGTDTWHTADAVMILAGIVVDLCAILVFGVMLIALSWKMTAVVMAGVAITSTMLSTLGSRTRRLGRQCVE